MFILNIQILNNKNFWLYMYDSIYSWLTLKKCLTARLSLDFDDLPREASKLILNIVWIYEILSIWIRCINDLDKNINIRNYQALVKYFKTTVDCIHVIVYNKFPIIQITYVDLIL